MSCPRWWGGAESSLLANVDGNWNAKGEMPGMVNLGNFIGVRED
jgi:hypothetical protein